MLTPSGDWLLRSAKASGRAIPGLQASLAVLAVHRAEITSGYPTDQHKPGWWRCRTTDGNLRFPLEHHWRPHG